MAIVAGLSILLGFHGKVGAWLLMLFLVPVTFMLHNFWAVKDPVAQGMQMAMFLKNISRLGGTLFHASRNWPVEPRFPPGPAR
jgi:putative oxidoreductase